MSSIEFTQLLIVSSHINDLITLSRSTELLCCYPLDRKCVCIWLNYKTRGGHAQQCLHAGNQQQCLPAGVSATCSCSHKDPTLEVVPQPAPHAAIMHQPPVRQRKPYFLPQPRRQPKTIDQVSLKLTCTIRLSTTYAWWVIAYFYTPFKFFPCI